MFVASCHELQAGSLRSPDANRTLFVYPEKQTRQRDSREQTNCGHERPLTKTVRHDDSDNGCRDQTDSGGEHEIAKRRRLPSGSSGNVRILVHEGKRRQRRWRCISLVLLRLVPVEQLPRAADREKNQDRCEEAAEIEMQCAQKPHVRLDTTSSARCRDKITA